MRRRGRGGSNQDGPVTGRTRTRRRDSFLSWGAPMVTRKKAAARQLGKQIKAQFCDGKWHSVETIAAATGARMQNVRTILTGMWLYAYHKTKADRKKVGPEYHFRLSPKDKQ